MIEKVKIAQIPMSGIHIPHERYLIVSPAPKYDEGQLVVRMHEIDKPDDVQWGDWVEISTRDGTKVICQLQSIGRLGIAKMYMNGDLRRQLGVKIRIPNHLYIKKMPHSKMYEYIRDYHPDMAVRADMRLKIDMSARNRRVAIIGIIISIVVTAIISIILKLTGS